MSSLDIHAHLENQVIGLDHIEENLEDRMKLLSTSYKLGIAPDLNIMLPSDYFTPSAEIILVSSRMELSVLLGLRPGLLSFDCEWSSDATALLQISLKLFGGKSRKTFLLDLLVQEILPDLAEFLNDTSSEIPFIAFDPKEDLARLKMVMPSLRTPSNLLDLSLSQGDVGSLSRLVESKLGLKLDKRPRLSFWNQRPLSKSQILYAAADAEVLLDLHSKMFGPFDSGSWMC